MWQYHCWKVLLMSRDEYDRSAVTLLRSLFLARHCSWQLSALRSSYRFTMITIKMLTRTEVHCLNKQFIKYESAILSIQIYSDTESFRWWFTGVTRVLKIPGVMIASMSIIVTSMSIGFLQATLEPHLRQFNLSPVVLGLMFVINGGIYAVTAPAWGWLCDKYWHPKVPLQR